jgi:hypothetical protein
MLGAVAGMTCLQELQVEGVSYTAAGLAALPVSLTKLCVSGDSQTLKHSTVMLDLDSTPALAGLTALCWLEVNRTAGFSAAVLRKMHGLQSLAVRDTDLLEAAELDEQLWEEGEDVEEDEGMG